MIAIHETAYPRLKPNPDKKDLALNFLPNQEEMDLLACHTRKGSLHSRLGFMLSLKCYQCLGYHISIHAIPKPIIDYISDFLRINLDKEALKKYMQLKQRNRHKEIIRKFLNINSCHHKRKSTMKMAALRSATTKENLADIINEILEELIKNNFEIPAFSTLFRLARTCRHKVNSTLYQDINNQLTNETRQFFDRLFLSQTSVGKFNSGWEYLKQEIKKPSAKNIRDFTIYIEQLRTWRHQSPIDLSVIPEHRLDHYVCEAMALDISDMKRLKESKKYALSAMLLYWKYAKSLDDIVTVLTRWLRKMKNNAAQALRSIKNSHHKTTDQLIDHFKKVLVASQGNAQTSEEKHEKLALIEKNLPEDIERSIQACERCLFYSNNNYLPLMLSYYQKKRHIMLRLIKQIEIKSSSKDLLVEKLFCFMIKSQKNHGHFIEIDPKEFNNFKWLDDQWFQFLTNSRNRRCVKKIQSIDKQKLELTIFKFILDEIHCADAFVLNSHSNDDPNKQFISWDHFHKDLTSYTHLIGQSDDPKLFIQNLQKQHHEAAKKADKNFSDNRSFTIVNGEVFIKRPKDKILGASHENFSNLIAAKMPLTDIVAVLSDVEKWLGLSRFLKPLSGYESKIDDYDLRFIATSFAYGCNVGPVQAERCLKRYSRKQIAWLFNRHMTEQSLNKMSDAIIKEYKKFDLPYIWGNGEKASVDGTYWDMYTNNLLAEHHIRYGKYGGIGYYHVSDQYVALFGNFIPCGVYEALYIFDGIYESDEDLRPKTLHGDTHAQNEVIFGFSYLLAITLMPRIRRFKNLNFYPPFERDEKSYSHIKDIFTSKEPNWPLIESMYYDMLRVVMSIQKGKVKASTILKKLCFKSRKNKLHKAFRELGRVVRTIFLLEYISDVRLRKEIQEATCKSEEFNDFIDWVAFGKDNAIHENNTQIQRKIISFGRLVANAVMFHTVANTTEALNQLSAEGIVYSKEDLSILSAYYRENINRYGVFELSRSENRNPVEFALNQN